MNKTDKPVERFLVVTIHDVSPLNWERCRAILSEIQKHGIERCVLLLIPDHQRRAQLSESTAEFRKWLNEVRKDNEICLHGYAHVAEDLSGTLVQRLIASRYTKGEGEFYRASAKQIEGLLVQGLDEFDQVGLKPKGFVAPAWLLNPEGLHVLKRMGFTYTPLLSSIRFLEEPQKTVRAPTLCYSVRSSLRKVISMIFNPVLARLSRSQKILRIAIHPVDYDHPAVFRQILRLIDSEVSRRKAVTYCELVGR